MASELREHFTRGERVDHRSAADEHREEAVEVRLALLEIVLELAPAPVRSGHVLVERERPRAHDVALRELRVLLQPRRAVDAIPGAREIREHRGVRLRKLHDGGVRIGRLDRSDVRIGSLPQRQNARRRIAYAVVRGLHVLGGERGAVVELHPFAQPERIGKAIFRNRPRLREIAFDGRILGRVELEQRVVVRANGVDERERGVRVAVVIRRLGPHRELEQPSTARRLLCGKCRERRERDRNKHAQSMNNHLSPPLVVRRSRREIRRTSRESDPCILHSTAAVHSLMHAA